ncbi:hypothetical protein A2853_01920 [Candidatus Kaiserbacteria bacterium RIFCSPHIGHO2_01_FULL_55_17]|uniref:NADH-quinone oxidoreductase subunit D domain-containing protein n=1 Tax=Candidatus Kaiserbacteria bacterium RIFCSPHIGHO2_01_FULL_55_17 TaxID=1798484 RepID=A0A1F6D8A5_9BACT|nr:MAG: hypothetical protein A2853_01920 [Candidatus Kaiserbacteria bacterium RIFCSPHIGHO2_01_FULL_55_17]
MNDRSELLKKYLPDHTGPMSGNVIAVPVEAGELASVFRRLINAPLPLQTIFASDDGGRFTIRYVFSVPHEPCAIALTLSLKGTAFPSLAREFPATALYERLIMTMFGLTAEGHPDPRSLILHEENWPSGTYPLRKDFKWNTRVPETKSGEYPFQRIEGEGIYEIPVGPVHAGIIEPGHFRFSVVGEEIIALEARLGWVHKGVEKLFENLPLEKQVRLAEYISGDSSLSHSLAYCEALETLTGTKVPDRARYIRLIFAELERLTMHIFDIGNIGGNGTGFTFMAAQGFRMAESLRQLSEALTGSRFLRGVNIPGGVTRDISSDDTLKLSKFLSALRQDFSEMMHIADASASLSNRLKGTGTLSREIARENHVVGIAARSCNIPRDARLEHPYAAYREIAPTIALETGGDVNARFYVRVKEVYESISLIEKAVAGFPKGTTRMDLAPLPEESLAIRAIEGWRGEIVYAIETKAGSISRVAVRDPSFIHWQLFPHLVTNDMVPDFPLINKSFNLSYSGNDL